LGVADPGACAHGLAGDALHQLVGVVLAAVSVDLLLQPAKQVLNSGPRRPRAPTRIASGLCCGTENALTNSRLEPLTSARVYFSKQSGGTEEWTQRKGIE
jgi:hypothetical protein